MTKLDIILLMKNWISREIKDLRAQYKLSQPALGELLGVSGNYIYLLEKGVKKPSKTLKILLGYIEKDLNERAKREGVKKYGKRHI
jgi:DNA-binding transcriptional regulator YiaG